jgi:protein-tyrosine phosphatase
MIACRGKIGRGGLWVGAKPPKDRLLEAYSMIVLCAGEYQPRLEEMAYEGRLVRCPMHDAAVTRLEAGRALAASRRVAEEIDRGGTVLVTCQMGINRSALVAGLTMLRLTRMTDVEVLTTIRHARYPNCLFNKSFRELLTRFATSPARKGGA